MPKNRLESVARGQRDSATQFSRLEKVALNLDKRQRDERPHVNLKYFHSDYQCFSHWSQDELRAFSAFLRKLAGHTWIQIYQTGGSSGRKTGLGYTIHSDKSKLPQFDDLKEVSEDITFFELRVDRGKRVHGFRVMDAFYLVWLDRAHEVYKS